MKKILFVDDEPLVLEAMERMLFKMRRQWEMRFTVGGAKALEVLAQWPADVVLTDMRMPQMNGAELLNEIMRRHPRTARIVLSGFADQEMIVQCVGGAHQFLCKPCDGETLRNAIQRIVAMDTCLGDDRIKTVVSRMSALPSLPDLYFEIMRELSSPVCTLERVGATIAMDPGMTAKMLQLVNSAFFGLRRQIADPTEAVLQLGLDTIKSVVLGIHVFSEFKAPKKSPFRAEDLWRHSFCTASTARKIAKLERQETGIVEEAFTAGLLHDAGRLILLANLPAESVAAFARSQEAGISLIDAEREILGATHAEVGGYLLGLWGLPVSLVEAAALHHCPGECATKTFTPLTAVHVANAIEQPVVDQQASLLPQLDREYLSQLGLWERAQVWRTTPGKHRFE